MKANGFEAARARGDAGGQSAKPVTACLEIMNQS